MHVIDYVMSDDDVYKVFHCVDYCLSYLIQTVFKSLQKSLITLKSKWGAYNRNPKYAIMKTAVEEWIYKMTNKN